MGSNSQQNGIIAIVGIAILGGAYWLYNNSRKLANLDYSVIKVKLLKIALLTTEVRASILIKNPSGFGVVITNYITEVYSINPTTKERALIVASKPSTLTIKANDSVVNDVDFSISNLASIATLLNLLKQPDIKTLNGLIAIKIKGEVLGNYFEKEILY